MSEQAALKPLLTQWGEALDKRCPLAEYPRPQLRRADWMCLNGTWQYAIVGEAGADVASDAALLESAPPAHWDGDITVPFSPESMLSGVQRQLLPGQTLWYRRSLGFAPLRAGERLLLHFGAVDQCCRVLCNGVEAGRHTGGYWPFTFDITALLCTGENELCVSVVDDANTGSEAYGKQMLKRGGIWYTAQSGIWQTVWCERVPTRYVQSVRITPLWRTGAVRLEVQMSDLRGAAGNSAARDSGAAACEDGTCAGAQKHPANFASALGAVMEQAAEGGEAVSGTDNASGVQSVQSKDSENGVNRIDWAALESLAPHAFEASKATGATGAVHTENAINAPNQPGIASTTNIADTPGTTEHHEPPMPIKAVVRGANGAIVAQANLHEGQAAEIAIPNAHSWTPDDPYLYTVTITAGEDEVESYFGMREFGTGLDMRGNPCLTLNGTPLFHSGLLDQGYWSDGMYTPPSDEAMVWDIHQMKALGFNMLRKHIKIEPLRWYYHCDRLGMLVWQDFVSGGGPYHPMVTQVLPFVGVRLNDSHYSWFGRKGKAGRDAAARDAQRTVSLLYNCASLAVWVPFNEGWGQFDAAAMCGAVRLLDNTRPIDHASGWHDQHAGDFQSYHIYYKEFFPRLDGTQRVLALTEFGGYSLPVDGHMASDRRFGYKIYNTRAELNEAVEMLYYREVLPAVKQGLAAAIYTQVSDVEDEINGVATYDRRVLKLDAERFCALHKELYAAFDGAYDAQIPSEASE